MPAPASSVRNRSAGRLEWPMVNTSWALDIIGGALRAAGGRTGSWRSLGTILGRAPTTLLAIHTSHFYWASGAVLLVVRGTGWALQGLNPEIQIEEEHKSRRNTHACSYHRSGNCGSASGRSSSICPGICSRVSAQ